MTHAQIAPGTLIHGTFLPADMIPAFFDALQGANPDAAARIAVDYAIPERIGVGTRYDVHAVDWEAMDDEAPRDVEFLLEALFDALDAVAPEGTFFGSHPGNSSDFGFWPAEEEEA